jgi:hypothetical protein
MIAAFNGTQAASPVTVTATYSISLGAVGPSLRAAVSLMSFQSIMSVEFIFNTSVTAISGSSMQVTFTPFSATYFKALELHYLVAKHPSIEILNGCFYSGNMKVGSGHRE